MIRSGTLEPPCCPTSGGSTQGCKCSHPLDAEYTHTALYVVTSGSTHFFISMRVIADGLALSKFAGVHGILKSGDRIALSTVAGAVGIPTKYSSEDDGDDAIGPARLALPSSVSCASFWTVRLQHRCATSNSHLRFSSMNQIIKQYIQREIFVIVKFGTA